MLLLAAEGIGPVLLELSAALEDRNAARFLGQIDRRRFRDYEVLETNVVALVAQYDVGSSVDVVEENRTGEAVELKLDWLLRLRPASGGPTMERKQQVRCRLERRGKAWKVTALEPVSFFSAVIPR
jgi:hypothetical protein